MALDIVYEDANQIKVALADTSAGDPVVLGKIPGVALTDTDTDGNITLKRNGSANFSVEAVDTEGTSAIALGDIIYYSSGDTPKLNKKNTGVRFGYALETLASGTATKHIAIGY